MAIDKDIINIIILTTIGGVFSLIGGMIIMFIPSLSRIFIKYSSGFTAGAIIAAITIDLLPESAKLYGSIRTFVSTAIGFTVFIFLNKSLDWFHHHHQHDDIDDTHHKARHKKRRPSMLIIGDTLHNLLDGVAIAIAYISSPSLGLTNAVLAAIHEIPQEIGDFSLLLSGGYSRLKVLIINLLSALFVILGGLLGYNLKGFNSIRWLLLGLSIGFLLSLATFDLLPDIRERRDRKQFMALLAGLLLTAITIFMVKRYKLD